jgi:hypothetical protein
MSNAEDTSAVTTPKKTSRVTAVIALVVAIAVVALTAPWLIDLVSPKPIQLTPTDAPANKGWQIESNPYWVHAKAVGTLPQEGRHSDGFVLVVFKNGAPYYTRTIDVAQLEKGHTFDFALKKSGQSYTAAFVMMNKGKPGRKLSNTISFTQ